MVALVGCVTEWILYKPSSDLLKAATEFKIELPSAKSKKWRILVKC